MLLAEDLLLLTDDDTESWQRPAPRWTWRSAAPCSWSLTLMRRVDVAGSDERVREGRLVVGDPDPTGDGLLDEALTIVGQKEGKKPQSAVARLGEASTGPALRPPRRGRSLRAEDDRILGIFPRHRWPSKDAAHESSVRAGLVTALREGATAEANRCADFAVARVESGTQDGGPGLGWTLQKELNANAQRIAEGDWAAKAVRQAIDGMNAAVIAAASAAVVGGGGGSSWSRHDPQLIPMFITVGARPGARGGAS